MKSAYATNLEKFQGICKFSSANINLKSYWPIGKHKANDCPFKSKKMLCLPKENTYY